MKNYAILIVFILSISGLSSCRFAYVPSVANVPLHEKKGDIQIAGYVGGAGGDLQTSLALSDHWLFNFNLKSYQESSLSYSLYEFGIGYFSLPDENQFFKAELTGGAGLGRTEGRSYKALEVGRRNFRSNYYKLYVQPSLGISRQSVDAAFTLRAVGVQYYNYVNLDDLSDKHNVYPGMPLYIEPIFTVRAGSRKVKFSTQLAFSAPLNYGPYLSVRYPYSLVFGLNLRLNVVEEN